MNTQNLDFLWNESIRALRVYQMFWQQNDADLDQAKILWQEYKDADDAYEAYLAALTNR